MKDKIVADVAEKAGVSAEQASQVLHVLGFDDLLCRHEELLRDAAANSGEELRPKMMIVHRSAMHM